MFNAIKYSKELEEAGFSREQAEATINVFYNFMDYNFATKSDHIEGNNSLRSDIQKAKQELRTELAQLREELRKEIQVLRQEVIDIRLDLALFKKEVATKFENLENRMTIKFGVMQAATIAILATLIKLL